MPPERRKELWEVLVFLFLIIPGTVLPLFGVFKKFLHQKGLGFTFFALPTLLEQLAFSALVFFFVWRNGESRSDLGWNWKNGWKDLLVGLGLIFPLYLVVLPVAGLLSLLGLHEIMPRPAFLIANRTPEEIMLAFALVVTTAFSEEIIFRGYLILRFKQLTGRPGAAAVLASVIFALGHSHYGFSGVIIIWVVGLFYSFIYLRRGSLVSLIVLHFLEDISIVLIPLLNIKVP